MPRQLSFEIYYSIYASQDKETWIILNKECVSVEVTDF